MPVKILSMDVSENATRQITALCGTLKKPVRFFDIDDPEDEESAEHGAMGESQSEYYTVYLSTDMERRLFEAHVLYELFHIRQYEAGFPTICYKDSLLFSEDREFVEDLGSSVFSGVLDMEVYDRLRECRYADTVRLIAENSYDVLISAASHKFSNLDDKYNFAHLVIAIAKVLYHTSSEQDAKVQESFSDYPLVLEQSFSVRDMLRNNSHDTPDTATVTMGRMLDMLDIWDLFYIRISDKRIRTKSEFESFLESNQL